ncbi:hypothetical protein AMECASPLE_039347 [Ameca splendens]|uniref:Hydroxypyruvate isomerase n=1 Tax=Ameca splendens TaxID=208324 RepID=A0ABV0ZH69_9TELE
MPALKFCANISWLFTELPDFSKRIYAAASAGFDAVEAAWLYDSDLSELQKAKEATRVEVVLINTPPGSTDSIQHHGFSTELNADGSLDVYISFLARCHEAMESRFIQN